jgi:hypothetical protein
MTFATNSVLVVIRNKEEPTISVGDIALFLAGVSPTYMLAPALALLLYACF